MNRNFRADFVADKMLYYMNMETLEWYVALLLAVGDVRVTATNTETNYYDITMGKQHI